MGIMKKVKSLFTGVVVGSLIVTNFAFVPDFDFDADAASVCTVNTNKTYQYIRGFGGIDLPEWQGYSLSDTELATAFGNGANQLGLTVLRVYVNPDKNQWKNTLKTAQYATKANATIFATPWEPPSSIAENGPAKGTTMNGVNVGEGGKKHLPKSNYAAYAQHLNDFGTYMKNNNVNLYSISVQNEPDYAHDWTYWSAAETTDFIANYGDKITSTRLMSPESFQYQAYTQGGRTFYEGILNNAKAFANIDVFGTHFYGTPRSKMDYPALENCGKEIWMTEVYVPNSNANSANNWPEAIDVAENIHNGLVVGNMSAYTWWYIKRSYSLIEQNGTNGAITKRGYMMAQYSKYVRPGDYRIDCTESPTDGVYISAYKHNDKQIEIVAVNKGASDYAQEFSISGRTITNINRYRTTGSENLAETKSLDHSTSSFFAQLPKSSVSTFVITLDSDGSTNPQPTDPPANNDDPITPDSNGYYYHDTFENGLCDWEPRGGSVELSQSGRQPYKDNESLVVTKRESAWQGVQKVLPSNTFKAGQSYSFSVVTTFLDSDLDSQKLSLSLQYTNTAGETSYAHIADATAVKGYYVQLANPSFKLPEGSDYILYVETAEGTDNFYIDEAIVAKDGTKIDGPAEMEVPTQATTEKPTSAPSEKFILGDVNLDGVIDAFDLVPARSGLISGFTNATSEKAADVDQNGTYNVNDLVILSKYILAQSNEIAELKQTESTTNQTATMSMKDYTAKIQSNFVESEPSSANEKKAGVDYGTLEKKSYYSNFCGREKKYNVLLPAGYTTSKKYPVMYVMHGYYEDQDRMILTGNNPPIPTQQIIGNAIAEGAAKEMIVVFPYIYSSKTQDGCNGMNDENNQAYDNFETVLINELMPLIEKNYSVATGKNNTAITGFSMGGRESLNIGTKHPDLFGYVGAICPAPGATPVTKFASDDAAPSLIFITAGGNDQTVYTTPNGYHESFNNAGTPHIWHYYTAGYHGDNSIRAHIYNFVRAAFQA